MENTANPLQLIQSELKAPKGQYNSFGKYHYRSCEDIVEAAKPILAKHGIALILSDEVNLIGGRYYIKATAKIVDLSGKTLAETCAFAREEETKKGMDASQITGTASSYARKYALNGLFAIDDAKDADSNDYKKSTREPVAAELINRRKKAKMWAEGKSKTALENALKFLGKGSIDELSNADLDALPELMGENNA